MRIAENEKKAIVDSVLMSGPSAKIYLFGSRADDHKLGGDVVRDRINRAEKKN
jgi:hypothetical protein